MQERYLLTNQPLFATTKKRYFHPKREETPHSRKLKKTKERKSMYTKMMWLTFIFLVGMAAGVFAVEVEVAEDGTLRATETQGWKGTGVSISDDARQYAAALQEAYKTPGKRVPVKTHREYKPRWPEITVTTIADTAVVYDEKERRIHLVTSAFVAETETSINLFLLSLGIAVLLMLVSNIFFWRGSFALAFAFALASDIALAPAAAFAGLAPALATPIIVVFAIAFASGIATAAMEEETIPPVVFGVFYVLIVLSAVVFYS